MDEDNKDLNPEEEKDLPEGMHVDEGEEGEEGEDHDEEEETDEGEE